METLNINWKNFISGESSNEFVPDAGFSPSSYGLNLTKKRGLLYFQPTSTDRGSGTLTGNPIAYAYDKNINGNDLYYVDDEGAFYTLSSATFTKRQTAGGTNSFTLGTTDLIQFKGDTFCTTDNDIIRMTGSNLSTIDSYWWTVTGANSSLSTSFRHPLEVVEDTMYIGDANAIHSWDGTTDTANAITLPTDVNITSLRKHPDGQQLIAFCGTIANFSHLRGSPGKMYIIDTNTKRWTREISLDVQVEGSRNVGGVIYVTYGKNVGYFNGNGISFLKRLETSGTTYSQSMGNMEDVLLIRDGLEVLAYGNLGKGNVWWPMFRNATDSNNVTIPAYKGDNVLTVGFGTTGSGVIAELDYDNSSWAGPAGIFYTNRLDFGQEVKIRRIDLIHTQTAAGLYEFYFYFRDLNNTSNLIELKSHSSVSASRTRFDVDITTDLAQFYFQPTGSNEIGLVGMRIFYEAI